MGYFGCSLPLLTNALLRQFVGFGPTLNIPVCAIETHRFAVVLA
ncbi:hypothetical protein D043_0441 [Vibrio parahaemolyticus EKP-021]|nr:hypothetical protein D043_0441 [Vibrio parahaemolyticus EKP-021]